jgi:hypothetical protein
MTSNSRQFSIEIDKMMDGAYDNLKTVVRVIALEALKRVVMRTPVLSGRARGNWGVSIGNSPSFQVDTSVDKSGTVTISKGESVIATYEQVDGFPVISLLNNLPYINRLENGYSKQSPAGMVAITVAELQVST